MLAVNGLTGKLSLPIAGMLIGMVSGVALGVAGVFFLEVESRLNQVCLVGISLLVCQLFGSTLGSAIGKGGEDGEDG
jgi:hypothetical protein